MSPQLIDEYSINSAGVGDVLGLREAWTGFWFEGGSSSNIAMARIIIATHALWIMLSRDFAAVSDLPSVFWTGVRPDWQWRFLLFPGLYDVERVLQWVAIIALCAVIIGVAPRLFALVAGVLIYHLAPLEAIIWTPNPAIRGLTIAAPALVILSTSRCGDTLAFGHGTRSESVDPAMDYGWQLKLILLLVCQIYLFSAMAKFSSLGFGWVSAANMRNWFLYLSQTPDTAVFTTLGPWLASHSILGFAAALGTIVFEAGFILVLFRQNLRRWIVPLALAFHTAILFAMNITFPAMPLLLLFVNWDWARASLRSRRALVPS